MAVAWMCGFNWLSTAVLYSTVLEALQYSFLV